MRDLFSWVWWRKHRKSQTWFMLCLAGSGGENTERKSQTWCMLYLAGSGGENRERAKCDVCFVAAGSGGGAARLGLRGCRDPGTADQKSLHAAHQWHDTAAAVGWQQGCQFPCGGQSFSPTPPSPSFFPPSFLCMHTHACTQHNTTHTDNTYTHTHKTKHPVLLYVMHTEENQRRILKHL